ncbi:hypothetical protein PROPEN_00188 [Proteus penneri ATCC 35198]|nr:hypothetical protein PROPEN_00188 [Proteus penneri ATCC 35198]
MLFLSWLIFYFNKENTVFIQEPEVAVMMSLSENVQAISDEKQIVGADQQLAVASQKKGRARYC